MTEYLNVDVGHAKTLAGFKSRLAKARRRNRLLQDRRAELVKQLREVDSDLDSQKRLLNRLEDGKV